jgi:hypothetical protein
MDENKVKTEMRKRGRPAKPDGVFRLGMKVSNGIYSKLKSLAEEDEKSVTATVEGLIEKEWRKRNNAEAEEDVSMGKRIQMLADLVKVPAPQLLDRMCMQEFKRWRSSMEADRNTEMDDNMETDHGTDHSTDDDQK